MKKTQKGFTLVELLVVIAIIAILATVSIIGYTSFVEKAKESNDSSLVKQLNTAVLRADGKDYANMHEVAERLRAQGFDLSKMEATAKNHSILWDMDEQEFFYTADGTRTGDIWIVAEEVSEDYNTYFVGNNIDTTSAKDICVSTNGNDLVINAPNANVYHFGDVGNLTIEAVKGASYHEHGRVTKFATVKKGHVVVEESGSIGTLVATSAEVSLSGDFGIVLGIQEVLDAIGEVNAEKVPVTSVENVSTAGLFIKETGVFYETFEDALAASDSATIVLMKDISVAQNQAVKIALAKTIVLDLNGHVFSTMSSDASTSYAIQNYGKLTIKDSVGGGKITSVSINPDLKDIPGYASNVITNCGELVLESGTIENTTNSGAAFAVDNNSTSYNVSFEMKGGALKAARTALRMFCNSQTNANNVIINDGVIDGSCAIWVQLPGSDSTKAAAGNLKINGGTIGGSNQSLYVYSYGNNHTATYITITGGTFNNSVLFGGGYKGTQETVDITGGTFNSYLGRYLENDGWEDIAKPN